MRPYSKVVQLISLGNESRILALCEDGSIWWFSPENGRFLLINEMDESRYGIPKQED